MEEMIQQNTLPSIPVEDFKSLAEAAPVALEKNTALVEKARAKSMELRARIEQGMDDEVDSDLNDHMVNLAKGKDLCFARRSPFTKMIQAVVSVFTGMEKFFDDEKKYFQGIRDAYAAEKIRIRKEQEAAAQRKLAYEKEKVEVKAKLESEIQQNLLRDIHAFKDKLFKNFNGITLENYEKAHTWFASQKAEYSQLMFDAMRFYSGSNLLTGDDVNALAEGVREGKFESFKSRFEQECNDTLEVIRDRLPGKKKELEEIAAAKGKEAERLKEEAEARRKQAEEEEKRRAEEQKRKAEEQAALAKEVDMTNTLFEHEAEKAATVADAPIGREGYEITVLHPAGYMELMKLWFEHEGKTLTVNDLAGLEKKTFKQLKTFAEKLAHKKDIRIESKFLAYTETFKTVAKK